MGDIAAQSLYLVLVEYITLDINITHIFYNFVFYIFHMQNPRTHDKLLPAICQNDIRKVLCDHVRSFLDKMEASSGHIFMKFCSLCVNRGSGSSVCNSKNMCLCTKTNHNCGETTLRLESLMRDFIAYRDNIPWYDNNVKIILDLLCTVGFTFASLYVFARLSIYSSFVCVILC